MYLIHRIEFFYFGHAVDMPCNNLKTLYNTFYISSVLLLSQSSISVELERIWVHELCSGDLVPLQLSHSFIPSSPEAFHMFAEELFYYRGTLMTVSYSYLDWEAYNPTTRSLSPTCSPVGQLKGLAMNRLCRIHIIYGRPATT